MVNIALSQLCSLHVLLSSNSKWANIYLQIKHFLSLNIWFSIVNKIWTCEIWDSRPMAAEIGFSPPRHWIRQTEWMDWWMDRDIQIIAVLFTFYTASQLFWYWSCMIPPFSVLFLGNIDSMQSVQYRGQYMFKHLSKIFLFVRLQKS